MAKYDALVSFRVPKEFKQALEAQARKERRSVSAMVLRVMEAYLAQQQEEQ